MILLTLTIDELKLLLRKKEMNFEYEKLDGTLRKARGTLKSELIPENMQPKDSSTYQATNLRYFDLDKNAWRSISNEVKKVKVL